MNQVSGLRRITAFVPMAAAVVPLLLQFAFAGAVAPSAEEIAEAASPASSEIPFELSDPARIAAGKDRFESTCAAYCHGIEPALFVNREGLSEGYVYAAIRDGGQGGAAPMPPWGEVFSEWEIWELVAYIKSIGNW